MDEMNDKEFKGYIKAKLETISDEVVKINLTIKETCDSVILNAKEISKIKTSDKIQMSFIITIILGLIGLFMKSIFG